MIRTIRKMLNEGEVYNVWKNLEKWEKGGNLNFREYCMLALEGDVPSNYRELLQYRSNVNVL